MTAEERRMRCFEVVAPISINIDSLIENTRRVNRLVVGERYKESNLVLNADQYLHSLNRDNQSRPVSPNGQEEMLEK